MRKTPVVRLRSRERTRSSGALLIAVFAALLVAAGPAQAQFDVRTFDGSFTNTDGSPAIQAGSHPNVSTTVIFTQTLDALGNPIPDGQFKDVHVALPPGLVGNPQAVPPCSMEDLANDNCPADSQVGVFRLIYPNQDGSAGTGGEPAPIYSVQPPVGVPAEFSFKVLSANVILDASVRPTDYGLDIDSLGANEALDLTGISIQFWGVPADSSHDAQRRCPGYSYPCPSTAPKTPLLTLPTSCAGPLRMSVSADSWEEPERFVGASFESHDNNGTPYSIEGCNQVSFEPTIAVDPGTTEADSPTSLHVDIHVPQNEAPGGIASSTLEDAEVTLPSGMSVSPSAADGLSGCSQQDIGLGNSNAVSCPAASKIGTVEIDTPLLADPLDGSVYLAQQGDLAGGGSNPFGSLLAIYVVAEADGVLVKLAGRVSPDPSTGQLTTTFLNNPQLPFTDFKLDFFGGPRAALVTPASCGTYTATASLKGWNGKTATPSDSFAITSGCGGGFSPSFSAGTVGNQAGAFSPFSVSFSRTDTDQVLGGIVVHTPPGLLGVLRSATQCAEPQASQGACGVQSLIGHTSVGAGPGSNPFYLGGSVYLTGPYKGAPFGLSIVVPALAGPLNLGTVVVRASISVDPRTAALTITSDPLPTILQGIPLDIRTVNVTVDRAGFMFNPTSCSPLSIDATVSSAGGASAAVSSRFQAAGCASLAFKPRLTASVQAKSSRAHGAALDVKIVSGAGQANIGRVAVSLPRSLPSRLSTIQKACLAATFAADPASCPAGSLVGAGTAATPILSHPLTGPAYLVSHGGAAFPDLVVVLKGEGITVDLTGAIDISKAGVTSSTFSGVPDVPISSFELKLPTGPHSALTANLAAKAKGSFCGQSLAMPTSITSQNGTQLKQTTTITAGGCSAAKAKRQAQSKSKRKK